VYEVAGPKGIPIIGQGGIASASDALEFVVAGASTIGLGTALFYDPLLCRTVNSGMAQYLGSEGLESIAQLVGTLDMGVRVPGAAC
jgi:dihydroorotate dehydrogenase (NAD+) catalytic subunit